MANALSNIVKAITSADSLRVRTQQLRGSVLETVCNFIGNDPRPAQNEGILLCPIKLHDRISSMWARVASQGVANANYSLALYGVDAMSGPQFITTFGTNNLISQLGTAANAYDEITLPFGTAAAPGLGESTIWQVMTTAQRTKLKDSGFKNDSSFILGLRKSGTGTETVAGLVIVLQTVEGAPSAQDTSITV